MPDNIFYCQMRLSGTHMPWDRTIDGKDIAPLLLGRPGARTPHDRFFYQQGGKLAAVRSGDWKLFVKGQLYNLKNDLGEKTNVAKLHPAKVKELQAMLTEFAAEIEAHARPVGLAPNSRTLVPRPGVAGEAGFVPTLSLKGKQ